MGPLAGKRIIEMGGIGPAPVCGMMFASQPSNSRGCASKALPRDGY